MRILIKNGTVVCPYENIHQQLDILIENGMIIEIAPAIALEAERVIDATGCYVFPGLIDMHVHLREPGLEYKEVLQPAACSRGGRFYPRFAACLIQNRLPIMRRSYGISKIEQKKQDSVRYCRSQLLPRACRAKSFRRWGSC